MGITKVWDAGLYFKDCQKKRSCLPNYVFSCSRLLLFCKLFVVKKKALNSSIVKPHFYLLTSTYPTNNALLINFLLRSDAEILLIRSDCAYKSAPNVQKLVCNVYIFRLSIHFAYRRWWLGTKSTSESEQNPARLLISTVSGS